MLHVRNYHANPRGGLTVVLKKPDTGESSDGNGKGQGCDEAAQHEGKAFSQTNAVYYEEPEIQIRFCEVVSEVGAQIRE
ncbi:hypothetical protein TNCV_3447391 [Trichonephila clavipes]|nr:hypothetical protein TNCV_3447391 [Trichonephila clavipes]